MCFDPASLGLTAIGGVLGAAGTAAENRAANRNVRLNAWANVQKMKQDSEAAILRNKILGQYRDRQHGYVDENQKALADTTQKFGAEGQEAARAKGEAERGATIQGAIGDAPRAEVTLGAGATPLVQQTIADRLVKAIGDSKAQGTRMAALGSYGDLDQGNKMALQGGARAIDTTNNFARGDISMLPADQDLQEFQMRKPIFVPGANPNNPASTLKGLGSLVGSLAGAYGKNIGTTLSGWFGST